LSKIISIATAVPGYQHKQDDILSFMQLVYTANEADKRKLRFLYRQSAIDTRYSVVPDYSLSAPDWQFYPASEGLEPFPTLEKRMEWFQTHAPQLSIDAITECAAGKLAHKDITHLITVSCTGLSPGTGSADRGTDGITGQYHTHLGKFYGLLCCHSCA
jgi:alkylresorcinol/alkylpyrone synthase